MASILKREFAPISDLAWNWIDSEAQRTLKQNLAARKVVDFSGPHGWELAAINLGRLENVKKDNVPWGIRQVQPLVETRIPFTLAQFELDNLTRGAKDVDNQPIIDAVEKAARFEDTAVFTGFDAGAIKGIVKTAAHDAIALGEPAAMASAVGQAVKTLITADVGGPYTLVLGQDEYFALLAAASKAPVPPYETVKQILQGEIVMSRVLKGGLVVSKRGGDFELTVGADYAIGYSQHDSKNVELFITESFTFRVIDPRAAVVLKTASTK
ncbi:MAG: family 1 encapsulin nanocompartment shell protein [Planctomycetaceae bacterium]